MTDPIADMLTRIRNAAASRRGSVNLPYSKIKESIAGILKANGFIEDFEVSQPSGPEGRSAGFKTLSLTLQSEPIGRLDRVSKPGRRIYVSSQDIPTAMAGQGIVILSTSSGVMTGREAKKRGLGGEVICRVVK